MRFRLRYHTAGSENLARFRSLQRIGRACQSSRPIVGSDQTMNCFNHPQNPAVGICKSCGKGLCVHCAAELPNGLACREACEERVGLLNEMVDSYQQMKLSHKSMARSVSALCLVLGLFLLGMAGWEHTVEKKPVMAIISLVFGASMTMAGIRFVKVASSHVDHET